MGRWALREEQNVREFARAALRGEVALPRIVAELLYVRLGVLVRTIEN